MMILNMVMMMLTIEDDDDHDDDDDCYDIDRNGDVLFYKLHYAYHSTYALIINTQLASYDDDYDYSMLIIHVHNNKSY